MSSGKIAQVVWSCCRRSVLQLVINFLRLTMHWSFYTDEQKSKRIVLEVALELGEGVVRTIAMDLLMD